MATTALVVELVVIGTQAMTWIIGFPLAFYGPDWTFIDWLERQDTPVLAGLLFGALTLSYTVGIIVDKICDNWILKWLNNRIKRSVNPDWTGLEEVDRWSSVHYLVLHTSPNGMAPVTEYIRSRMRIVRGLVLNLPLATAAIAIGVNQHVSGEWIVLVAVSLSGIVLTLLAGRIWWMISRTWYRRIQQSYHALKELKEI